ncbi:dephospho-CoA kinase [Bacillus phage 1_ICo-2020]|uniref:Dephospho-CoA kinase n=1 Tax=Bacillus phage 1_ICo-2020 TaxID=2759272 RepID=A0A7G8AKG5_9CAUD|nr:dephospho-CoA kinase [Bacillus phage 1_ICo-2020]
MKKLPDIALIGKMRSGKDEFASILLELGYPASRIAFGDSMKGMFSNSFPWIPMEPKPIQLLQHFGQSMRAIDEDVFVKPTLSKLWFEKKLAENNNYGYKQKSYIFTDVRQPNEYEAVRKAGFIPVRIYASEKTRIARMIANGETVSQDILNAPTEKYLESFPVEYTVSNDGTREEFKQEIVELIEKIQAKEGN